MKWLAKLFAATPKPSPEAKKRAEPEWHDAGPQYDWTPFEIALAALLEEEVRRFGAQHPDEQFYAIALDCNAQYGDILICANTPETLDARAERFAASEAGGMADARELMRWGVADWKYAGFNLDAPQWRTRYKAILPIGDELHQPQDIEGFLETVCRSLIRAERAGVFECLSRTPDFRIACMDHDEDMVQGDERLDRLRAAMEMGTQ